MLDSLATQEGPASLRRRGLHDVAGATCDLLVVRRVVCEILTQQLPPRSRLFFELPRARPGICTGSAVCFGHGSLAPNLFCNDRPGAGIPLEKHNHRVCSIALLTWSSVQMSELWPLDHDPLASCISPSYWIMLLHSHRWMKTYLIGRLGVKALGLV